MNKDIKIWLFSPGLEPEDFKLFEEKHIDTIIVENDANRIQSAIDHGLKTFMWLHCFSAITPFDREEYLCRDVDNKPHIWFGSACPNKKSIMERMIETIEKFCSMDGVKGVFLDGCRFSSPCSSENIDAFLTCFCTDCCKKCEDLGFDVDLIRRDVKALQGLFSGVGDRTITRIRHIQKRNDLFEILPGLRQWMDFRITCVNGFLKLAKEAVLRCGTEKKLGIYSFFPSLSPIVGQWYKDMIKYVDIFSPMLYRRYNSQSGPACMDHEISRLVELLSLNPKINVHQAIQIIQAVTGFPLEGFLNAEEIKQGLQPFHAAAEAKKVMIDTDSRLVVPIMMMDDPDISGHFYEFQKLSLDKVCLLGYKRNLLNIL